MRIAVLAVESFSSKKGVDFVKLSFLKRDGTIGEVLTTKEKYASYEFDEALIPDKKSLAEIFDSIENADIEFDQRGYVQELSSKA